MRAEPAVAVALLSRALLSTLVVVDRVEEDRAVLEWPDGTTGDVPLSLLPVGTREGDQLQSRFIRVSDTTTVAPSAPDSPTIRLGVRIARLIHPTPKEDVSHADQ